MALRTTKSSARARRIISGSGLRVAAAATAAVVLGLGLSAAAGPARSGPKPRVWTVGTWQGKRGQFGSIQAAVDAASPGDWIVIAPGDYKERGDYTTHRPATAPGAGVWIDKPGLHLLGLSRGGVIVDGTRSGPPCSASPSDQDRGPAGPRRPWGRNGIEVYGGRGVTSATMTACSSLSAQTGRGTHAWSQPASGPAPGPPP